MTGSDLSVLAFLSAALIFAPRTLRSTILMLGATIICATVALLFGNTELLVASGADLAALVLAGLGYSASFWKYHWSSLVGQKFQGAQGRYKDTLSGYKMLDSAGSHETVTA